MSLLDQLSKMTTIVCDTGDIDSIKKYQPVDATTNPSLILQAASLPQYRHLLEEAVAYAKAHSKTVEEAQKLALQKATVNFGVEILKVIPGRVSTEVDARLAFDVQGCIAQAKDLIELYRRSGIPKERILIKLAATWEGILAAKELEKEKIACNLTLMFCLPQAVACAEAKVTLISPFVGRIFDWYCQHEKRSSYLPEEDPGVLSVSEIYAYFKKYGYKTQVMGASFRNAEEIVFLAGCDLLTISPKLLEELQQREGTLERRLSPEGFQDKKIPRLQIDEKTFRFLLNENPMATDKLADGIRRFAEDAKKLEKLLAELS